eukprot:CAMPEP_0183789006 /NCGR_PEP_ID=MMETSP0803_2-20130417/151_1 /TAXON_ID=195967 /ORGANISM="Crustomastix stigmata, Strain CCMP3273" /LENGTH=253 /DNA_ID=CAMNT_0026033159 /DNA_START=37 /DNA_END=798 /DNA_ORIENTATION=+
MNVVEKLLFFTLLCAFQFSSTRKVLGSPHANLFQYDSAVDANWNQSSDFTKSPTRRKLTDNWRDARATWYGGPSGPGPDGMDITKGSCGYGAEGLGNHFVTALNTDGGYDWGLTDKCGQCFEVMCVDGNTRGTEYASLGPWKGCKEAGIHSVVVKVTDSCPCHHPNGSNKRWCCGDAFHFDLSYAAFDAIAFRDRGVVDLKVREISCDFQGKISQSEYVVAKAISSSSNSTHTTDESPEGSTVKGAHDSMSGN